MTAVTVAGDDVRGQLLDLERRRWSALLAGDLAALDEMFDATLVHVHAPGLVMGKAALLEHVSLRKAYLGTERGDLDIRLVGDVAVMTGPIRNRLRTAEGGERTLEGIATQVAVRDDGDRWRFISFQMTPTTEQAWPSLPSQQVEEAGDA